MCVDAHKLQTQSQRRWPRQHIRLPAHTWQVTHTPRTHCRCLSKHVLEQRVCGEINVLAAAAT